MRILREMNLVKSPVKRTILWIWFVVLMSVLAGGITTGFMGNPKLAAILIIVFIVAMAVTGYLTRDDPNQSE